MLQLSPENAEEYIEYLHSIDRLDEAAVRLAAVVNDERFVSKEGKSNYQVRVLELPLHPASNITSLHPSSYKYCPCFAFPASQWSGSLSDILCSPLQLWHELCDLISQNPDKVKALNVGAIIRGGLTRFTDQLGKLWCSLADYYIRSGHFEKVVVWA